MTTTNQKQLGNSQLAIADQLRRAMDACGLQLLDRKPKVGLIVDADDVSEKSYGTYHNK